ncbi:UDP-glycosyltransferase UGT5-like [Chrysoperla carnea]|uniref:UDP-glycosyltransferase UGT5-like n=1 Tax=Chrysoperla carnea TaxID=189513 RepID=UPI001D0814B8|nr:UDP-glycosyltransferase UGT5-like [Chrysoperla carnea]
MNFKIVVCLIACFFYVDCAKILGLFPSPSKSHIILGQALFKSLANHGHNVTFVSPYSLEKTPPNYRELIMKEFMENWFIRLAGMKKAGQSWFRTEVNPFANLLVTYGFGDLITKDAMEDGVIKDLIKSNEKYDIVISEVFMNDVFLAFADHFDAHAIAFSTVGATTWTNDLVGNPSSYSVTPNIFLRYTDHMTFIERLMNTLIHVWQELIHNFSHLPEQERIRQKYLPHTKPLSAVLNNVSLVFLNSHPSLSIARPLVPNMIEIAGFHVDPPKPLPADLKKILDEAKHGVIYFSMGSNLDSAEMPKETLNVFLEAFKTLKQTVLWKFGASELPGKPNNVIIQKWFPQSDLLAHPNVKLFITHGGFLSTLETVTRGVPIIGLPMFGDQKMNMAQAVTQGYGKMLDFQSITKEDVCSAIDEVLSNTKYSEIAKTKSALIKDRIVNPKDEAAYWVEYILRHNGASHLSSARKDINLFQYLLLDIIGVISVVIVFILVLIVFVIKKLLSLFKKNPKRTKSAKKTNFNIQQRENMSAHKIVLLLFLITFCCVLQQINGAKILVVFPTFATSHLNLGEALAVGLAERGHEVTMVSPRKLKKLPANYTEMTMGLPEEMMKSGKPDMFQLKSNCPFIAILGIYEATYPLAEHTFKDAAFQKLLQSKETYDIVIMEAFMNEAVYPIAEHLKAKLVLFSTTGPSEWTYFIAGNPTPYSYVPNTNLPFTHEMTLGQRMLNTILNVYHDLLLHFHHLPRQAALSRKHFPKGPSIYEVLYNKVSLILYNSDVSLSFPQPLHPNQVEIGGFHIKPTKPLPVDLKKLLDNSKNGVIYFSMGSNLESKNLPVKTRDALLTAFGKLKQTVLWKFEDENLPGKPSNVIVQKWFPQSDLLAHPNIKLFITHGGLLSTFEAIKHAVPLVGIPVFGDQMMNMGKAQLLGYGVLVELNNITEQSMTWAINEVLNNPKYAENAKSRSGMFNDQMIAPLDRLDHWMRFIAKHEGASRFRSAVLDLSFYQRLLLDVIAIYLLIIVAVIISTRFVWKTIKQKLCKNSKTKVKTN